MATKIELISNALILIGDLPITSLDGNTRAQTVANNLYDNIVQSELTKFTWGFARKKAQIDLIPSYLTICMVTNYTQTQNLLYM
mgnify:CR=1 FL=1